MLRGTAAILLTLAPGLALAQPLEAQSLDAQSSDAQSLDAPAPELVPEDARAAQTSSELAAASAVRAILEGARAWDARTEYEAAAQGYERYARTCAALETRELMAGEPCDAAATALARAFELRRALGHLSEADANVREHIAHFLYAQPREVIALALARAELLFREGDGQAAEEALDELAELLPAPPPTQALVADALRARIAAARGRAREATQLWRRVERRFAELPPTSAEESVVPREVVLEAVAEGRLARADAASRRFLAVRAPDAAPSADEARWWAHTMSPWLVRSRRRLLLARMELERVYELGSPAHSVVAAARIGSLYEHQAGLHAALELPADEWIQTLVAEGRDRPGYDEARQHLEACVRWAAHHGVASETARRCEASLHRLDPYRYPIAAELHGAATYQPAQDAIAPGPIGRH